ncbi:MAG: hypothetical protein DMF58_08275 [Acidobacteria bacterium]|nr:MAG: hypothetical protein DMF58_08275 [Acidobacteriota bacterium]
MIAIVTALPEELSPLLKRAAIDSVARVGGRRAHVGTLMGTPVVLMATGAGVAQAEKNLAQLLQRFQSGGGSGSRSAARRHHYGRTTNPNRRKDHQGQANDRC